jgi:hypothetical protein
MFSHRIWGDIPSNYDEMVILPRIGSQSLINLKRLYHVNLRLGIVYETLLERFLILCNPLDTILKFHYSLCDKGTFISNYTGALNNC